MEQKFSKNTSENRQFFVCEKCDYKCNKKSDYDKHINTLKHKNATISRKKIEKYECVICDVKCSYKCDYDRHINTLKHKKREKIATEQNTVTENPKSIFYCKECDYTCQYLSLFEKHKKRLKHIQKTSPTFTEAVTESVEPSVTNLNDILIQHSKQTEELKEIIIHQSELHQQQLKEQQEQYNKQMKEQQEEHNKQIQDLIPQLQQVTNINNNNCNNTTNNKFNLNFFLNEQCKDAISIQNFIENLNIGIPELEHMGNVGYVQGMMSIFSNTLGAMDIYKRPLHCTDLKRETLYIKQGDTWKKDTDDKTELKKLIKTVEYKNYGSLRLWEREHPEAFECDTQDNIDYMRISNESLGGFDSTDAIKLGKIMKHVVKEVYIK